MRLVYIHNKHSNYLVLVSTGLMMDELKDLHYLDALASLLSLLMDCAKEAEFLDEKQINQLLDLFVGNSPICGESA